MNLVRRIAVESVKCTTFSRSVTARTALPFQLIKPTPQPLPSRFPLSHVLSRSLFTHALYRASPQLKTSGSSRILSVIRNWQKIPPCEQSRSITAVSRLGKRKTCKSVLKRFRRVKGGFLKRWRSGMVKKQRKKSSWRKFRLRGSILVKRKSHLRTLNKMMYKY